MSEIKKMKALSLFSSAGIAEFGFDNTMIDVVLANELLPVRMNVHKFWHPEIKTICGDITDDSIKQEIIKKSKKEKIDFVFATPPCQGISLIGKNKMLVCNRRGVQFFARGFYSVAVGRYKYYADENGDIISRRAFMQRTRNDV